MPRTSPRGGPQTRERIAATAAAMFAQRGFEAVTVTEVAHEAGVSAVTVFKHFPRKEDLFLDRAEDAAVLLRAAVRERPSGASAVEAVMALSLALAEQRHPLSGLEERSAAFFATVAASPTLLARARQNAHDLQQVLAAELDDDDTSPSRAAMLAAFFIAGYACVLTSTARRRIAGQTPADVAPEHRSGLETLFRALRAAAAADG